MQSSNHRSPASSRPLLPPSAARGRLLRLLAAFAALASPALAEPITFRVEGTVAEQGITRAPWNAVSVGDPVFFEYTFESATPDGNASPSVGLYAALGLFTFGLGPVRGAGYGGNIGVQLQPPVRDTYTVDTPPLSRDFDLSMVLFGAVGTLSSDVLPLTLDIADWGTRDGYLVDTTTLDETRIAWTGVSIVPQTRACCAPGSGYCGLATAADCAGLGGTPQASATCSPNPCVFTPPGGACCAGGLCSVTIRVLCGPGVWQGAGTVCEPAPGVNACCHADFNNSGAVSVQDIFDFLAAYFAGCP